MIGKPCSCPMDSYTEILQNICGPEEKSFDLVQFGKPKLKYTIQVGDECLVAPLGLFYTELLNVTGTNKQAKVQKPARNQPDAEDCFDAEYLRETSVSIYRIRCFYLVKHRYLK